jgi:gliding motility-associated-like protein
MCKKKPENNATCTSCSSTPVTHPLDSSGVLYFVPTAFTPNGDGENEVFWIVYKNLDTNSSKVTIWDINGTEVFAGKITQRWGGKDLNGVKCPAGQYSVYLEFKTLSGATINTCTCVNILTYTNGCIKTNGVTYYFVDQVNTATPDGFVYPTNETLCP